MPQTSKFWTNTTPPLTSFAVDAKFWNTITAPNRNLDFLNLISTTTPDFSLEPILQLSHTLNVANFTPTIIPWSTVVTQNYPYMWSSVSPQNIYLRRNSSDTNGNMWYVETAVVYPSSTAGTFRQIQVFADNAVWDSGLMLDQYRETAGSSSHTFGVALITPSVEIWANPYVTIQINHRSGATLNSINVKLRVSMIPSIVSNYF